MVNQIICKVTENEAERSQCHITATIIEETNKIELFKRTVFLNYDKHDIVTHGVFNLTALLKLNTNEIMKGEGIVNDRNFYQIVTLKNGETLEIDGKSIDITLDEIKQAITLYA